VFFVWVVGVTEVIKDGYCLNDAFDCLLAECSDTRRHNGKAAEQVLTQFIIEFANALGVIVGNSIRLASEAESGDALG